MQVELRHLGALVVICDVATAAAGVRLSGDGGAPRPRHAKTCTAARYQARLWRPVELRIGVGGERTEAVLHVELRVAAGL